MIRRVPRPADLQRSLMHRSLLRHVRFAMACQEWLMMHTKIDLSVFYWQHWRSSRDWCRLSDVDANSEPSHWDARAAPAIRRR
jgi:hypothetical protein